MMVGVTVGVGVIVGVTVGVGVGPGQVQSISLTQSLFRQWPLEQIKLPLHCELVVQGSLQESGIVGVGVGVEVIVGVGVTAGVTVGVTVGVVGVGVGPGGFVGVGVGCGAEQSTPVCQSPQTGYWPDPWAVPEVGVGPPLELSVKA